LRPSAQSAANLRLSPAVPLFRPTFGDPPTCVERSSSGKADNQLRLASDVVFWLGWLRSPGFHRLLPLPPRMATPPACVGGFTLQLLPAVNHSACASQIPFPAEPLMHSLFRPNLASPDKPSMSIRFSTGPCILRNPPAKQLPTCVGFCIFWCVQRSLYGSRRRFHPLSGLAAISPALTGCSFRQPYWCSTSGLHRLYCLPASGACRTRISL